MKLHNLHILIETLAHESTHAHTDIGANSLLDFPPPPKAWLSVTVTLFNNFYETPLVSQLVCLSSLYSQAAAVASMCITKRSWANKCEDIETRLYILTILTHFRRDQLMTRLIGGTNC